MHGKTWGKGLPGTNVLACYKKLLLTGIKSFIALSPGYEEDESKHGQDLDVSPRISFIKLFFFVTDGWTK